MMDNYTKIAKQRCFDLIDNELDEIWANIEKTPADTNASTWKKKLIQIVKEYTLSSRFALMRIFMNRADQAQWIDPANGEKGFSVVLENGDVCKVENITMEHAKALTKEELAQFKALVMEQASRQSGFDRSAAETLIDKALTPVHKKTTLLTRVEAFDLGHTLSFTLQEMEWFLLRVFDLEEGFSFHSSNDLIEAYGFLCNTTTSKVEQIKSEYKRRFGCLPKPDCEEKEANWTRAAGESLSEEINKWSVDEREEKFLAWLQEKAKYLDLPSKTALCIYRNLAVYAYNMLTDQEDPLDTDKIRVRSKGEKTTEFYTGLSEVAKDPEYADSTREVLFDKSGNISTEQCKRVADCLLEHNFLYSFTAQEDLTKAWHVPVVNKIGKITVNGSINASRSRVKDILMGKVYHIEKSDMLYLLWFIANICWEHADFDVTKKREISPRTIRIRMNEFIDVCENCLDAAGLPGFYPPHVLEQSMMLSIVCAYSHPEVQEDEDEPGIPAQVYEFICESTIARRPGAKKDEKKKGDGMDAERTIA